MNTTNARAARLLNSQMETNDHIEAVRSAYGLSVTRKQLKEFEKTLGKKIQWKANRAASQSFRTPLGFVRSAGARATFLIPQPVDGAAQVEVDEQQVENIASGLASAMVDVIISAEATA
jgi:hypothetical protein